MFAHRKHSRNVFLIMNRAFLYGDGFFETIYVNKGEIPLFDWHWKRARKTALSLEMNWPDKLTEEVLKSEILSSCGEGIHRARVTFYRNGGGYYIPETNEMTHHIWSDGYELPAFASGIERLMKAKTTEDLNRICVDLPKAKAVYYELHKKNLDRFSALKGISSQFYVMAGVFAKGKGVDDVVLFNHALKVSELLLGNIIVVKNNQWYTPDVDQGSVDGVMRAWLLDRFKNITLTPLNKSHLENADLLLGCNALRGLYRLEM